MSLSNQKFIRANFLLLMRVHGLVVSVECCFHCSWFRVLIKCILVLLQLIILKIHTNECFSVCHYRTFLSNNLQVFVIVNNFKSFVKVERTFWVCMHCCAYSVQFFVHLSLHMRCIRVLIGAGLCSLTQSSKLIDYPSCCSFNESPDEI